MAKAIRRQDSPPAKIATLHVVRLKAGQTWLVTVCSRHLFGCFTHWAGSRTEACLARKTECLGCKRGMPRRWKGYLHVYAPNTSKEAFVELTPTAARSLEEQFVDRGDFRGVQLRLERGKGGNNSRLQLQVTGVVLEFNKLPEEKDPFPTLANLWGLLGDLDPQPVNKLQ